MGNVREAHAQVLVIGAGPSGLFAAAELARHGVAARVVERAPEPHRQARATALQPGTLEILGRAEVLDAALAASVHLRFARVFDADLRPVGEMAFAGVGCPWEFQCSLPQWRTERILADRLAELGGAVERGVAASSLVARDDGLLVALERADGTQESVEAEWVIGGGGAHRVTRASMAEALEGETYPGAALVADVRVRCALPRDGGALVATPAGYVMLAPLPDERWITFVGDLDDAEADRAASDTSIDAVAAVIERRVSARSSCRTSPGARPFACSAAWSRAWPRGGGSCWATPATCRARSEARA
jgi:6-methylpretetramide 4-monooxygenase / 4-hydroxy-6-methylpretetramide 12a-monooxygenase